MTKRGITWREERFTTFRWWIWPTPHMRRGHIEIFQVEIDIQIHHQHPEYGWLRLSEQRLESHLLMSSVETIGKEESAMNEEKVPKLR